MENTAQLLLTRDALERGRRNDLYRAHASGELVKIRHGVYVPADELAQAKSDEAYRLTVRAAMSVRRNAVATSVSATALLGLPVLDPAPRFVYLLSPGSAGRKRNGVIEVARRGGESIVATDGCAITSVAFSIVQACRHVPFTSALSIVESAIHVDRFGLASALTTIDDLWTAYRKLLPFPGSARVRAVLDYATPFADTPLETVSRVVIDELGFPQPEQQYELWLPRLGQRAFIDFAWPQYRIGGEADGWGKYFDPRHGSNLTPIERVKREKRRDDAIRALGWTPAHWEWADWVQRERLLHILLDAGLPRVRRPRVIQ